MKRQQGEGGSLTASDSGFESSMTDTRIGFYSESA